MVRLVVMAAGLASRMGQDKLALPWKGSTILGQVLDTVMAATANLQKEEMDQGVEIVVVARQPMETYLSAALIDRFQAAGGIWLQDPAPRPLSETIKLGLQGILRQTSGIGFLPGDQVGLTPEGLTSLIHKFLLTAPEFLIPTAAGVTGSPVFFNSKYIPELFKLQGEQGGRQVLQRFRERWTFFPFEHRDFSDVDTPEEYLSLLNVAAKLKEGP